MTVLGRKKNFTVGALAIKRNSYVQIDWIKNEIFSFFKYRGLQFEEELKTVITKKKLKRQLGKSNLRSNEAICVGIKFPDCQLLT